MRVAVKNHALPVFMKNRIALLLCIFETIIALHKEESIYINSKMGVYCLTKKAFYTRAVQI